MNKRQALEIIINSLEIIPVDLKQRLTKAIPQMPDDIVDQIGKQLAALKFESIQVQKNAYNNLAKLVNALDSAGI